VGTTTYGCKGETILSRWEQTIYLREQTFLMKKSRKNRLNEGGEQKTLGAK
jgi:hypothetical protein